MTDYNHLLPNTMWNRRPTPQGIVNNPYQVDLGAWIQPGADPVRTIVTVDLGADSGAGDWLHISVSRKTRLPSWPDLLTARDELGYGDLYFLQQLPPKRYWLNDHQYCLHLMHRLDQDAVPRLLWAYQVGATGENYEHGK